MAKVPTEAEIESMVLQDLRSFLEDNGVNISIIKPTGKTPNRPTKKDLVKHAFMVRAQLLSEQGTNVGERLETNKKKKITRLTKSQIQEHASGSLMQSPVRETPRASSVRTRSGAAGQKIDLRSDAAALSKGQTKTSDAKVSESRLWFHIYFAALLLLLIAFLIGAVLSIRISFRQ